MTVRLMGGAGIALALVLAAGPAAAQPTAANAGQCTTSLIGTALTLPKFSEATQKRLDQDIEIARAALRIAPDREDSHIWLGRRLDYAGRICDAVDAFTDGLKAFPNSYKLYRFRARDLTRARQFDAALADYSKALELMGDTPDSFEPDGLPNPIGLTISTIAATSSIITRRPASRRATIRPLSTGWRSRSRFRPILRATICGCRPPIGPISPIARWANTPRRAPRLMRSSRG